MAGPLRSPDLAPIPKFWWCDRCDVGWFGVDGRCWGGCGLAGRPAYSDSPYSETHALRRVAERITEGEQS